MRRIPIAHVVFPRFNAERPVHEFIWEAVRAVEQTRDLDVDVYMPIPVAALRGLGGWSRRRRGAVGWPDGLEESLHALSPSPTLVPFVPVPRRSIESASASVAAHLLRQPRARRPKVVQGSFLDQGGYAATVVARVLGCSSIVVAHGSDVRAARGEIVDAGRRRRAQHALRQAHRVVAVSHRMARDLVQFGVRSEVLPFTSSGARFSVAAVEAKIDPPEVLFVGRVEPQKGVDVLLDAFARLDDRTVNLRLVGPVSSGWDVHQEIATRGLEGRVFVHGEVPQDELPMWYARATCTALLSRAEGLPCVLVESLLMGRPVVATDVGGVRELVTPVNGRLVEREDSLQITEALHELLRAPAHAFAPARVAQSASSFSWEAVGPRLVALTRDVLKISEAR